MIFIIDSGSTKCDWIAIDTETGEPIFEKQRTKGLNPAIISDSDAFNIIIENDVIYGNKLKVTHVYFYGAGCGTEKPSKMLKEVLESIFLNAEVVVEEDTYAAIYATVHLALDTWHLAPGTWQLARGTRHLTLGSWKEITSCGTCRQTCQSS